MPRPRRSVSATARTSRIKPKRRKDKPSPTALPPDSKTVRGFPTLLSKYAVLILVLAAILFILFPTAYRNFTESRASGSVREAPAASDSASVSPALSGFRIDQKLLTTGTSVQAPLRIIIPSLEIDISIKEAKIINGFWELSETTASHGAGTANPGQNGNIVIFAHAREKLFLPLRNIKSDALVYILTKDSWHRYQVTTTKLVNPNDVMVIAPTKEETLTLFTCSGFLDSKRLIVSAKPYRP